LRSHLQTCKAKKKHDIQQEVRKELEIKFEKEKKEYETTFEKEKKEYETKFEKEKKEYETKFEKEIEEKNNENKKLKDYIIKLETKTEIFSKYHDEIINIAKEPRNNICNTTTNKNKNNISINNANFLNDTEKVKKLLDSSKYDRYVLAQGQKGIAKFAVENILTDDEGNLNYICSDPSRGIFKYQNDEGEFEKDVQAEKLTNLLFKSELKEKTRALGMKIWTNEDGTHNDEKFGMYQPQVYEISKMDSDNSIFRNKLACLTTNAIKK